MFQDFRDKAFLIMHRQGQYLDLRILFAEFLAYLYTIQPREVDIQEDHIRRGMCQFSNTSGPL